MRKLTSTEAAQRLGVGKSTVNLWCNQGRWKRAAIAKTSKSVHDGGCPEVETEDPVTTIIGPKERR